MNKIKKLKDIAQNMSVLCIEDEDELRREVVLYLKKLFGVVKEASNGEEAFEIFKNRDFDIVITDIRMPKMDGVELVKRIKEIKPEQETAVISAYTECEYFINFIELGISGYIIKPIDYNQLNSVIYKMAEKIFKFRENEMYRVKLENLAEQRAGEITKLHKEKLSNYKQSLMSLIKLIENRDTYTAGHSQRVAKYCVKIAQKMGFGADNIKKLYQAGILHDIGKISTPDSILLKPGKLNDIEYQLIQSHVTVGYNFLSKIPMYRELAEIIKYHHERYDGRGYPYGVGGDDIPILSHIMIIADAFDAMTTNRIYKNKKSVKEAIKEIKELSGKQFHPDAAKAAISALNNISIQKDIDQLPKNKLEEERFAYFYKDSLTGAYNKDYFELYSQNRNGFSKDKYVHTVGIFLRNFSQYNKKNGWDAGDILLKKTAAFLMKTFNNCMVFRVWGDDFIILCKESINIEEKFLSSNLFFGDFADFNVNILEDFKKKGVYFGKVVEVVLSSVKMKMDYNKY